MINYIADKMDDYGIRISQLNGLIVRSPDGLNKHLTTDYMISLKSVKQADELIKDIVKRYGLLKIK